MSYHLFVMLLLLSPAADTASTATSQTPPEVEAFLKAFTHSREQELREISLEIGKYRTSLRKANRRDDTRKLGSYRSKLKAAERRRKELVEQMKKDSIPQSKGVLNLPVLNLDQLQVGAIGRLDTENYKFTVFQIRGPQELLIRGESLGDSPPEEKTFDKIGTEQRIYGVVHLRGWPTEKLTENDEITLDHQAFLVKDSRGFATGVPGAREVPSLEHFDLRPVIAWLKKNRGIKLRLPGAKPQESSERKTVPKTAREESSPKDQERRAAGKLRLALKLIKKRPRIAKRRLEEIIKNYPETEAAVQAKDKLADLR